MAVENNEAQSTDQGPAARTGDTEDGLYPDTQGDLGHKKGGDTESLPGSNEPLAPESGVDESTLEKNEGDPTSTLDSTIDEQ